MDDELKGNKLINLKKQKRKEIILNFRKEETDNND